MSARSGRPNATGRSSGRYIGRDRKIYGPPPGAPWTWLPCELLESSAWRHAGINCRRLIDFLMVEHRAHGSRENGNLRATYDRLVEWGLTRSETRAAIEEAEAFGLLRFTRGERWAGTNQPSIYRLTFYADRDGSPATNEWKRLTPEAIAAWKEERRQRRRGRQGARRRHQNSIAGSTSRTTEVRVSELPDTAGATGPTW